MPYPEAYRIGSLRDPQEDDPSFTAVEDAEIAALNRSYADESEIIGVWHEDGEILAVVYEGRIYRP